MTSSTTEDAPIEQKPETGANVLPKVLANEHRPNNDPPVQQHQQHYQQHSHVQPQGYPIAKVPIHNAILTPALKTALFSAKDRMFVVQLEQDLLSFIQSNTDSYLLKPMNSYYRLLTHQTAQYYSLGHSLNNEGNSILVFKNIGVDLIKPQPLASIPPPIELQQHPSLLPIGSYPIPPQPGFQQGHPAPHLSPQQHYQGTYGFVQPNNFGYQQHPQQFQYQPQSPHNYQPNRQFAPQQSRPQGHGEPAIVPEPVKLTPKEFKLMKREDSNKSETNVGPSNEKGDTSSQSGLEEGLENLTVSDSTKDSVELESERASRESLYQKAKERIFQDDGGEEEDEEEEEERDEDDKRNLPRRVPHHKSQFELPIQPQIPQQQPQIPAYIPQQAYLQALPPPGALAPPQQALSLSQQQSPIMAAIPLQNVSPQIYYQYPPGPQFGGSNPNFIGYNDHRKQYGSGGYYNNAPANGNNGGYRKNRGGYGGNRNYSKSYNNNYNNGYNNYAVNNNNFNNSGKSEIGEAKKPENNEEAG